MLKFMPADARAQLDAVANALTGVLGERLEGLYLHGSAAMGCFGPLSDIDLVGVSGAAWTRRHSGRWRTRC